MFLLQYMFLCEIRTDVNGGPVAPCCDDPTTIKVTGLTIYVSSALLMQWPRMTSINLLQT